MLWCTLVQVYDKGMLEIISNNPENEKKASELTILQLALAVKALGELMPEKSDLVAEAVK